MKAIKDFFNDLLQQSTGKIAQNILDDLKIEGEGTITINIGEISIKSKNLFLKIFNKKNKQIILNTNIPIDATIKPEPILIPIKINVDLNNK